MTCLSVDMNTETQTALTFHISVFYVILPRKLRPVKMYIYHAKIEIHMKDYGQKSCNTHSYHHS